MSAGPTLRVIEANARAYRRTWRGSIVTTVVSPVLYLAAMGLGLGSLVSHAHAALGGVGYVSFIAPGLLAATAMQTAAGEAAWPVMAGIKWVKTYHAALATPVGVVELVTGNLAWIAVRLVITALVFGAVTVAFGAVPAAGAAAAAGPALLTGMAFAAPVTAYTAVSEQDTRLTSLFRFGIVPMFLFSGTFFPVSQLPGWLQPVAYATPLFHGVELTRAVALGLPTAWPAAAHAGYLLAFVVVGWAAAIPAMRRRLQP